MGRQHGLGLLVDNTPLLIMRDPGILREHLSRAMLTEADLRQSLRQAGIRPLEEAEAVVTGRDGSISVLKSEEPIDAYLLDGVTGYDEYRA